MLNEKEQKSERLFKFHIIRPNIGRYMFEQLRVVIKSIYI